MAKEKKIRDKAAEKAVKARLSKTHIKSYRILGSEVVKDISVVYMLRIVETTNYLFKINCVKLSGKDYEMSGLIPVNDPKEFGEYRVYNPKEGGPEALRPTKAEMKFTGYGK